MFNNNNNADSNQNRQPESSQQRSDPSQSTNTIRVNIQMNQQGMGNGANNLSPPPQEAVQAAQAALRHPAVLMALARNRVRVSQNNNAENGTNSNPNLVMNINMNTPAFANANSNVHANGLADYSNQTNAQTSPNASSPNLRAQSSINLDSMSTPTVREATGGNRMNAPNNNNALNQNNPQVQPQSVNISGINLVPVSSTPVLHSHQNRPLPPLKAEPVPIHKQKNDDDKATKKTQTNPIFDCGICFDILDDPTNCSNCKTRYCFKCISRVLDLAPSMPPSSEENEKCARCPTCRNTFTAKDLTRDTEFKTFMENQTDTICTHHGCNQKVPLTELKQHEAECPHMLMKCKYAPFGCKWTGPKMHLDHHHEKDCNYHRIEGFVELYRNESRRNKLFLSVMQDQLAATNRQVHLQQRMMVIMQTKSNENIFHLLELGFRCTCYPTSILLQKDKWKGMFSSYKGHATVNNFFVLFPYFVLFLKKSFIFFNLGIELCSEIFSRSLNEEEFELLLYRCIDCFIMNLLGCFVWFLFKYDKADETSWNPNNIKRDLAAISLAAIHYYTIASEPNLVRGYVLSIVLCGLNFLPALITSFALGNEQHVSILSIAKASAVVLFGLRYGIILHILGIISLCEGVVLLQVCCYFFRIPDFLTMKRTDCIFCDKIAIGILFLARIAFDICEHYKEILDFNLDFIMEEWRQNAKNAIFALFVVSCVNAFTGFVHFIGKETGTLIIKNASRRLMASGDNNKSRMIIGGQFIFCAWVFSLSLVLNAN